MNHGKTYGTTAKTFIDTNFLGKMKVVISCQLCYTKIFEEEEEFFVYVIRLPTSSRSCALSTLIEDGWETTINCPNC